jgi:hypothetical protein
VRAMLCPLSLLGALLIPLCGLAQPDTLWTVFIRHAGSVTVGPVLYGAAPLSDGTMVVVGLADPLSEPTDALVARISGDGSILWCRTLGASASSDVANAVVQTSDRNLVVVGTGGTGATPNLVMLWGLSVDGDSLWVRSYASAGATEGSDAKLLPDGNILITGYRPAANQGNLDLWLLKCTPAGDTLWTRLFGGAGTDVGNAVVSGTDGRLMVAGSTTSVGAGDYDVWLLTTDSLGHQISSVTSGTSATERCADVASDGETVWIAGRQGPVASTTNDAYLVKADMSGAIEWAESYDIGRPDEQFCGVAPMAGGAALCVGWAAVSAATKKPWIAEVSSNGILNSRWVGNEFPQGQLYGVCAVPNGGFLIYGTIIELGARKGYVIRMGAGSGVRGTVSDLETQAPLADVRIGVPGRDQYAVTDAQGWFQLFLLPGVYDLKIYGPCVASDTIRGVTVEEDSVTSVELTAGRPIYHVQQTSINIEVRNRMQNVWPVLIDNLGAGVMDFSVQARALVPAESWLSVTPSQGIVPAFGSAVVNLLITPSAPDDGVYDYYGILDVHAHSCPDSTDAIPILATVLELCRQANGLPSHCELHAAFPNPFNATTRLSYSLPRAARVELDVFDLTGRKVRSLVEGKLAAGFHEIDFDGAGLASGLYLVRMESGDFAATRKLLLVK